MITSKVISIQKNGRPTGRKIETDRELYEATKKQETRRRLLSAAQELFASSGYDDIRPKDIARKAGVGAGTFYLYFEDKLECFLAFTNEVAADLTEMIRREAVSTRTLSELLCNITRTIFDYSVSNPGVLRIVTADTRMLNTSERKPFVIGGDELLRQIEKWKQLGEISRRLDSYLISYFITGALKQGAALIYHSPERKEEIVEITALFLSRGLRPLSNPNQQCQVLHQLVERAVNQDGSLRGHHSHAVTCTRFRTETRDRLLNAAREIFTIRGFEGATVDDIALLASVGASTFYIYFQDKLDCFVAFSNASWKEFDAFFKDQLEGDKTLSEMIFNLVRTHFQYSLQNPGVVRAILADLKVLSKTRRRSITRGIKQYMQIIENFRKTRDVVDYFDNKFLGYLVSGAIYQGEIFTSQYPDKVEETIESVAGFLLRSIMHDKQISLGHSIINS